MLEVCLDQRREGGQPHTYTLHTPWGRSTLRFLLLEFVLEAGGLGAYGIVISYSSTPFVGGGFLAADRPYVGVLKIPAELVGVVVFCFPLRKNYRRTTGPLLLRRFSPTVYLTDKQK